MLQLHHKSYSLAFQYPFTIAKGTKTEQPNLIVSLGLGAMRGFGETTAIHYYNVAIEPLQALLEEKRNVIERYSLIDPERFWHFLHHLIPGHNFLISALDMAAWDLFGYMRRASVRQLLQITTDVVPASDYTIGLADTQEMIAKMQAHPWRSYKIKIHRADDIDRIIALRAHTQSELRIDANESLSFDDCKHLLPDLHKLGVSLLEQPLAKTEWDAMKELKQLSSIPLFADESCVEEHDVQKCITAFDGINIKLSKCGGITPAFRMLKEAKAKGLATMLGSMNESSIGTAAATQLAPLADYIDLDGPLLLSEDLGTGLTYPNETPNTLQVPGLGVRFVGKASKT